MIQQSPVQSNAHQSHHPYTMAIRPQNNIFSIQALRNSKRPQFHMIKSCVSRGLGSGAVADLDGFLGFRQKPPFKFSSMEV